MLRLTYSNRTERLLEALTATLAAEREAFGPWEPIHLVVPNPNVKRYLVDGLSRSLGVLANFQVDYLDTLWKGALKRAGNTLRIWSRSTLQGAILSILAAPDALDEPDFAPLKAYLQGEGRDLKLIQLAERAAGLLEDYSLSRPDWAAAWMAGRSVSGAPESLEAWQRGLWARIVQGTAGSRVRWTTLAQLLEEGAFRGLPLPPRIHVFGLSVAEVYHRAFEAMAGTVEVDLYSLNPCEEFWDDLETGRDLGRQQARRTSIDEDDDDPFKLLDTSEPLLLQRWGRPGRENVRLLNEISGCDFETRFADEASRSQLQALQLEVQQRKVLTPRPATDGSIKLLACPNGAREAEVVAGEIWQLMEAAPKDRPLRFSDIAVVVPPDPALRAATLDHLRSAFDATGRIPFVEVDAPSPAASLLLDGAELLLDLPLGRGSRRDLLRALTHPAVLAHFPDLEPGAWPAWTDAAGIVRGLGPEDLAEESALEPGLLHWEQGLERIALAAFLPADAAWTEAELGKEFHRPSLSTGSVEATGPFLRHANRLVRDLQSLREARLTPAEWGPRLQDFLLDRLGGEDAIDGRARTQVARALEGLADLIPEGMDEPVLSYRQARELATQALAGLRGETGGRPHQGVVVGSYAHLRTLPFRAVFLMGLGEGLFPAVEERNPLDLRNHRRRAGDVSPAERDRYLFLEMLLCTRDALRLSYPTEDPLSKEERLPSSLVMDLLQALDTGVETWGATADGALPRVMTEVHPRYRFDPATYFPDTGVPALRSLAPGARREALAHVAGAALRASGIRLDQGTWHEPPLPGPWRQGLDDLVGQCATPARPELPETLTVRLNHLRAWLECPVQGTARARLRLRDEEEDPTALEEEPMESSNLVRAMVRRTAFLQAARQGVDLDEAFLAARMDAVRRGQAPPGIFGEAEVAEDRSLLERQFRALQGDAIELVCFGPATGMGEDADHPYSPLELDVPVGDRMVRVRLVGALQPQVGGRSLFIEKTCGVKGDRAENRATEAFRVKALRATLDQHLLAAREPGERAGGALCVSAFDDTGKKPGSYRGSLDFPSLSQEAAQSRLRHWLTELLTTEVPALLPIEAVVKGTADEGPDALLDAILERAADPKDFSSFKTGPLRRAERYPVDADPATTVDRRLRDFLSQTESGQREEVP